MHAKEMGNRGERTAEDYFRAEGYEVVARNFRQRGGEIDLIMRRDASVLFVEVKTRDAMNQSSGPQDVHPAQVRRLARMAESYVMRHGIEDWRFVLACVIHREGRYTVSCVELTESLDLG